jgi:hypothetical protein
MTRASAARRPVRDRGADRMTPRRRTSGAPSILERGALPVSLGWIAIVGWVFATTGLEAAWPARADPLGRMTTMLGIVLPLVLVWVVATVARTARILREESLQLREAIDSLRFGQIESRMPVVRDDPRLDEVIRAQETLGAQLAALAAIDRVDEEPDRPEQSPATSLPAAPPRDPMDEPVPEAPEELSTPSSAPALSSGEIIRALDFPEDEADAEGFRILRAALDDPLMAGLVIAAQDVLTFLSQDGIYMDDLSPPPADPAAWRALASGATDDRIAAVAAIRDRACLALVDDRMGTDAIFRDAAGRFLEEVLAGLHRFVPTATDDEVVRFADTRTGRAFMLLGFAAGLFGPVPDQPVTTA